MNEPLAQLLYELEAHRLEVQLVPVGRNARCWTGEHSMKRCPVDVPPKFYRELCRRHQSSRGIRRGKFDTKIKRANVLALLRRLASGLPSVSKYADELRRVAERRAA